MKEDAKVIIIGGGLSGLTLGYLLMQKNIIPTILEASTRIGGRIHTISGTRETPMELGATWFSDMHPKLLSLIDELGLNRFPQFSKGTSLFQTKSFEPPQEFYVPGAEAPSYRVAGGTGAIIDALVQRLPQDSLNLGTKVHSIKESGSEIWVETTGGTRYHADKAILCLPPQLVDRIEVTPAFPEDLKTLLPNVQTWMAGAVKFVLEYEEPFWRKDGYSGMLYSHSGIVAEMYDHCNFEETKFGFTGFLNNSATSYSQEVRKELVLRQLGELMGEKAQRPLSYSDKIWIDEFVSSGRQDIQRPHQNNGHPLLQRNYMNGKLFFSGTETATEFGGYMEGAVISAYQVLERILQ